MFNYLTTCLCLLISFSCTGQTTFYPTLQGNAAKLITNTEDLEFNYALTGSAGAYIHNAINDDWSLNLGIMVDGKGFDNRQDELNISKSERYFYIQAIPEIEYYIWGNISASLGLNVGFKMIELHHFEDTLSKPSMERVDVFDLGYRSGLNFYVDRIKINVHINNSLLPVAEYNLTDINGNLVGEAYLKHSVIQLGFGYKI